MIRCACDVASPLVSSGPFSFVFFFAEVDFTSGTLARNVIVIYELLSDLVVTPFSISFVVTNSIFSIASLSHTANPLNSDLHAIFKVFRRKFHEMCHKHMENGKIGKTKHLNLLNFIFIRFYSGLFMQNPPNASVKLLIFNCSVSFFKSVSFYKFNTPLYHPLHAITISHFWMLCRVHNANRLKFNSAALKTIE